MRNRLVCCQRTAAVFDPVPSFWYAYKTKTFSLIHQGDPFSFSLLWNNSWVIHLARRKIQLQQQLKTWDTINNKMHCWDWANLTETQCLAMLYLLVLCWPQKTKHTVTAVSHLKSTSNLYAKLHRQWHLYSADGVFMQMTHTDTIQFWI